MDSAINSTTHALQRSAMFPAMVPWNDFVSLRWSEEKFFGGRAFYKHLATNWGEEQQYPVALPS